MANSGNNKNNSTSKRRSAAGSGKNSGRSTSNRTGSSSSRSTSARRSNGSSSTRSGSRSTSGRSSSNHNDYNGKDAERTLSAAELAKRNKIIFEIVFIVTLAVCVLLFIACFSDPLIWLRKISYFLFGKLMYVWPFIIVAAVWISGKLIDDLVDFFTRGLGLLLILFSVSGIFSAAGVPEDGGLLGRANYAMFFAGTGKAATIIIDIFIFLIGLLLITKIPFADIFSRIRDKNEENRNSERNRQKRIDEERRYEEQRRKKLEKESRQREETESLRRENDRQERKLQISDELSRTDNRTQKRYYGIGNTSISDDVIEIPDSGFETTEAALEKNGKIFVDTHRSFKERVENPEKQEAGTTGHAGGPRRTTKKSSENAKETSSPRTEAKDPADDIYIPSFTISGAGYDDPNMGEDLFHKPVSIKKRPERVEISELISNQNSDSHYGTGGSAAASETASSVSATGSSASGASKTAGQVTSASKDINTEFDSYFEEDMFAAETGRTAAADSGRTAAGSVADEDEIIPDSALRLTPEDHYEKVIITATGKTIVAETDGDIMSKKKIIYNPPASKAVSLTHDARETEYEDAQRGSAAAVGRNDAAGAASSAGSSSASAGRNSDVDGNSGSDDHTGSAAVKTERTTAKDNMEAAAEIAEAIAAEPEEEYVFPPIDLLKKGKGSALSRDEQNQEITETAQKLELTLKNFGVSARIVNVTHGPTVTCYEIQPEVGVKVAKIVSLTDDIKLNLAAADIRIEAPIPGKSAIGIEVPNKVKTGVAFRDLIESREFDESRSVMSFATGRDIEGKTVIGNIEKMPHVLVAGATGSGKSVCINTMIMSIIYHAKPTDVKMIMIDPKVVELSIYNGIPHLLLPVVTEPKKAAAALNWAVAEMENRYQQFAEYNVRNIEGFNYMVSNDRPVKDGVEVREMSKILIIVDELADLMMVAASEVETAICRLAQKARAAGIHLVLATQRPSVDVITGLIKANVPSRIAFAVSSGTDSRTILDQVGAEKLLGMGDMLYSPAGSSKPIRLQGSFVSDKEISDVVDWLKEHNAHARGGGHKDVDLSSSAAAAGGQAGGGGNDRDEYFADAGRLVIDKQKASIGMLQRAFKLGFNRAARIVDQLADAGVVGEEEGTKPRRVLMTPAEFEDYLQNN